jgi:hypothetical protein
MSCTGVCTLVLERAIVLRFSSSPASFAMPPLPPTRAARVNVAKYVAHPHLQADLLSTGHSAIHGAPSTGWQSAGVPRRNSL